MTLTESQYKNIEDWIRALRSGDYKQGKNYLLTDNHRYCCLGVKCSIDGVSDVKIYRTTMRSFYALDTGLMLGRAVASILNNNTDDAHILAAMNDSGSTFNKIADLLEYFLEVVRIEAEVERKERSNSYKNIYGQKE